MLNLVLYVSTASPRGHRAALSVEAIVATLPGSELKIVDVHTDPAAAETAHIVATPTLVRMSPGPARRIVGDLSDRNLIRRLLLEGTDQGAIAAGEEEQA